MKKMIPLLTVFLALLLISGCGTVGNSSMNYTAGYTLTSLFSAFMLIGYILLVKHKDGWMTALFISIILVNIGYLAISVSSDIPQALTANRLAYLGSVTLPLAMSMITRSICKLNWKKWTNWVLIAFSVLTFLVASTPGFLDIYYKSVSLTFVDGSTILTKEYGTWHNLYLVYLLSHFTLMTVSVVYAYIKGTATSSSNVFVLLTAVFVNFIVWLFEQFLSGIQFEFLSISYNITEIFILNMYLIQQDNDRINTLLRQRVAQLLQDQQSSPPPQPVTIEHASPDDCEDSEQLTFFSQNLSSLTPKEREIFDCYLNGMRTAEILTTLNIKENTLKYHNKNIYSKLGVNSRKELEQLARTFRINT